MIYLNKLTKLKMTKMTQMAIQDVKVLDTIQEVEDIINFKASKTQNNPVEMIIRLVEYYGKMPRADFKVRNNSRETTIKRQVLAVALTMYTKLNQHEISKHINRNRTIVSYSNKMHENFICYDKDYRDLFTKVVSAYIRLNNKYEYIPEINVKSILETISKYEKLLKELQEFLVTITFLKKKSDDPDLYTGSITD
ncbi:MAG: hypothetical protein EBU90_14710 [Proteobacteria bacterium]|nr:hypothetical protein [Pseudomonadota bacterium]